MAVSRYFFNYRPTDDNPHFQQNRTGVICRGQHLLDYGASYLRLGLGRYNKDWNLVPQAGWHFTSINDASSISEKFRSYSHQGRSKAVFRSESGVDAVLQRIRAGEFDEHWARSGIDERLPDYVRQNQAELTEFLL